MNEKVMEELKEMSKEEGISDEPSADFIFKNRTTTAKHVFLGLSFEEQ